MVKAFNTLSAWTLQNGPSDASRQVLNSFFFAFIIIVVYILATGEQLLSFLLPNCDTLEFTHPHWLCRFRLASANVFNSQMCHTVGVFLS